jgi:hypothetical protein
MPQKPYSFVSLPDDFETKKPIWHDGSSSNNRLSGEVRFEIENLTPLLVGWERQQVGNPKPSDLWPLPVSNERTEQGTLVVDLQLDKSYAVKVGKSVLCPLRAPLGDRPVLIPGDSIKGLLRHELGALLGAPMERVAERSYSYRPNMLYVDPLRVDREKRSRPSLYARIARVLEQDIELLPLDPIQPNGPKVRVPTKLELLPEDLRYDEDHDRGPPWYRFDPHTGTSSTYRGGQGAGVRLNSKKALHRRLGVNSSTSASTEPVPKLAIEGYLGTIRHLIDTKHGHFCEQRHPDVPKQLTADTARTRIIQAATQEVFQPGDLIWVEWDTGKNLEDRKGLFPLPQEKGDQPEELSLVRRLFGYTGDNDGCAGIGKANYSQLMGRISVNAAIEVIEPGKEAETDRFEKPIFLKELGQPKPSAVENYLKQPYFSANRTRPLDTAKLVTYGDAAGYDTPGQLAGRKFYLDREDAYPKDQEPWKDDSAANRLNERSTLALEVSKPERRFRFTLRFRNLDPDELAAVLLALSPNQFAKILNPKDTTKYCSKLGYGRPLGLGTVCIEAKELHILKDDGVKSPALAKEAALGEWFARAWKDAKPRGLQEWLKVHQQKHPDGKDYERNTANGPIYAVHTKLRAEHSKDRRYK